jgi:copper resistance protein C
MVTRRLLPGARAGFSRPSMYGLAVAGAIVLSPAIALAHAHLSGSDPEDGAVVDTATPDLTLTFSEGIEADFSTFTLVASESGEPVGNGLSPDAGSDPATVTLTVSEPLPPGSYTLQWEVLALDGHVTSGEVAFTVAN